MKDEKGYFETVNSTKITRKEAIMKGSKFAALTAASMLIILNPAKSQTTSPALPTAW